MVAGFPRIDGLPLAMVSCRSFGAFIASIGPVAPCFDYACATTLAHSLDTVDAASMSPDTSVLAPARD